MTQTTDSFIDEVSEEVRRDKLYGTFRRYGWIGAVAVLVIVGGAAWNEWRKSSVRAAAEAAGDAILAALQTEDQAARGPALVALAGSGVMATLLAANETEAAGDRAGAVAQLTALSQDMTAMPLIRDLALFKSLILQSDTLAPADRITALSVLTAPGAPFRLLAKEQIALAHLQAGDRDAATAELRQIAEDAETSGGLGERVTQLLTALGAEDDA